MSSLGPELETVISEDYGFKKLGQTSILPSYDEKLPFASLQNLDISNAASLYVACSGGKIVIGKLQLLRDYIQNDAKFDLSFLWEREAADVIAVKFIRDEEMVFVNRVGQVFSVDLKALGDPKQIYAFDRPVLQVKVWRNCALITLDSQNRVCSYHLEGKQLISLMSDAVSFDLSGDKLCTLHQDCSVQTHTMQSFQGIEKKEQFTIPKELQDEIQDEYSPISISALSPDQYQLVFGVAVPETEEDVSYDHKIYVVSRTGDQFAFQESFDMTPAFGTVLRYPTYYNTALPGLFKNGQRINILASSCSSEVTIWDSAKVIQPDQDSERAVLPISKVTDNDTNPVGVALDLVTEGTIAEPCPGVSSVDKLPLIYILNNEGSLQIVGVYHSTAIKQGDFNLAGLKQAIMTEENAQEIGRGTSEYSGVQQSETPKELQDNKSAGSPSTGFDPIPESNKDSKPTFAGPGVANSIDHPKTEKFGKPLFGSTDRRDSLTDKPTSGQSSLFGKPAFGVSATNNSSTSSSFGKSAFGAPTTNNLSTESAFGKPAFGVATDSTSPGSAFGKPAFGVSVNDTTNTGTAFGKPAFGLPATDSTSTGPAFGKPAFGAPTTDSTSTGPAFGKPAFGKPAFGQSSFGQSSFGSTAQKDAPSAGSAFGKPAFQSGVKDGKGFGRFANDQNSGTAGGSLFGKFSSSQSNNESPFASLAKSDHKDIKPAFGLPSFGENNKKDDLSDTPKFGQSPFSTFGNGVSKSDSPFASLTNTEKKPAFGTPSFGSSGISGKNSDKPIFGQSPFGGFASSHSSESPFASLAKNESKSGSGVLPTGGESNSELKNSPSSPASPLPSSTEDEDLQSGPEKTASKEEDVEEAKESAHSSNIEDQNNAAQPSESDNVRQNQGEPVAKEEVARDGSSKERSIERDSLEIDNTKEGRSLDTKSETPDDDLSDSTVEQTLSKSDSSITSLTARIRESANISSTEIKSPIFSQPLGQERNQSPFAKFANDLNKPSSTGFLFSRAAGVNKDKENSKESSADTAESAVKTEGKPSKFNFEVKKEKKDAERKETPEQKGEDNPNSELTYNGPDDNKSIRKSGSSSDHSSASQITENCEVTSLRDSSPDSVNGASREESYDTLDDITRGELESAGIHGDTPAQVSSVQPQKNADVTVENENVPDSNKRNLQMQAYPPTLVSSSTQVVRTPTKNAECQTDPAILRDSNIQSFDGDEAHLAVQYKPKPLPDYFLGATIKNIKYSSQDPVVKSIERTYHYVSSELSVLSENVANLGRFIDDQSADHSTKRNEDSLTNIYTWRIPEAHKLQLILNQKKNTMDAQFSTVQSTNEKISGIAEEKIKILQEKASKIRDDYSNLVSLNQNLNSKLGELKYHQVDKQSELRKKMLSVSETIQHVEQSLQILKVHAIGGKKVEANSYFSRLVREAAGRESLLHDIACLRDDIKKLSLKREHGLPEKNESSIATGIQSIEVVEVGLALNTKKQLGELLKKRKDIET